MKILIWEDEQARVWVSYKSTRGTAEDDLKITKDRANAVVAWLVEHGIPAARLQSKPLGRSRPLTENETPTEIQRNERIVLARPPM